MVSSKGAGMTAACGEGAAVLYTVHCMLYTLLPLCLRQGAAEKHWALYK